MDRSLAASLLALLFLCSLVGVASAVAPAGTSPQTAPNGTNTTNATEATGTNETVENLTANATNATGVNTSGVQNATNSTLPNGTTTGGQESGSGGLIGGFTGGIQDAAGEAGVSATNSIFAALTEQLAKLFASLLLFQMEIITARGAPLASIGGQGVNALFGNPDAAVYGTLYDINQQLLSGLGITIFGLLVMLRWFGAGVTPGPRAKSMLSIASETGVELLRLLLSWFVPWAHFLVAAALSIWILPSREQIASSGGEVVAALTGGALIAIFAFFISFAIVAVVLYLLYLHFAKFVHALVGLAVYPLFVAFSIPQGKWAAVVSDRASDLVYTYPEAAWYPFPTAVTLGIGYAIAGGVTALFGDALAELSLPVLAAYYPVLWIGALYAPAWVFGQNVRRDISTVALGSLALGGGAGAAGASASAANQNPSALPPGVQSNAMALGLPGGVGGSNPPKDMMAPSPGADVLNGAQSTPQSADPWSPSAQSMRGGWNSPTGASALGDGYGNGSATGATGSSASETSGASTSTPGDGQPTGSASVSAPSGVTRVADRETFDFKQGYEPVRKMNDGYQRIDPAKDASWTIDGGFDRMNKVYDDDLYLRGDDGKLYDPRDITSDAAYSDGSNTLDSEDARTVRDTRDP